MRLKYINLLTFNFIQHHIRYLDKLRENIREILLESAFTRGIHQTIVPTIIVVSKVAVLQRSDNAVLRRSGFQPHLYSERDFRVSPTPHVSERQPEQLA